MLYIVLNSRFFKDKSFSFVVVRLIENYITRGAVNGQKCLQDVQLSDKHFSETGKVLTNNVGITKLTVFHWDIHS